MKNPGKYTLVLVVSLLLSCSFINGFAEGSRELNSNTHINARRIYLSQAFTQFYTITSMDAIESQNNFYVYANAGDSICLASSALGIMGIAGAPPPALGSIGLRRPDGTVANFWNTAPGGVGRIQDGAGSKARENQGPFGLYNAGIGGYTPVVFVADQTGIYTVNFSSTKPTSGVGVSANISTSADFLQNNNSNCISAFDISIVKNGILVTGRTYANYISLSAGSGTAMQYFDLNVLTREGYNYLVSFRALQPYGYFVYTDNVGVQLPDGITPAYESIKYQPTPPVNRRIMVPDIDPETAYETKHKMFFNSPDIGMPATALLNNVIVWLKPVFSLSTYYVTVNYNNAGSPNPMTGDLSFNIANFGIRYKMQIDINSNNIFEEPIDVVINGATNAGLNTVPWDGTDGTGAVVAPGCFNVKLDFIAGELHVPIADAENFRGGIRIRRLNGNGVVPNDTIHWNDLPLADNTETPAGSYIKKTPPSGVSSSFTLPIDTSIRRWESTAGATIRASHTTNYGDTKFMDQWAFDTLSSNIFTPLACFNILPFNISKLAAEAKDVSVYLTWHLDHTTNYEPLFIIERSSDGTTFIEAGKLKSLTSQKDFLFVEKPGEPKTYYYRVKWLAQGNQWIFSTVKTVHISASKLRIFKAFPIPAYNKLTIECDRVGGPYQYRLLDVLGKELLSGKFLDKTLIDLGKINVGTYYINVVDHKGNRQIEKIQVGKK